MGLFNFQRSEPRPKGARGYRAYAVGDIHGRLDLLDQLIERIRRDIADRPVRKALIIFLGDLIDRGPNSAQVIERLRSFKADRARPVFLLGNHEEVMLRVLKGDTSLIQSWMRFGGRECLKSYGVDPLEIIGASETRQLATIRRAIPREHVEFLKTFSDTCRFGDYLFVHAGIRPGIALEQQLQTDLRWIRDPFLFDDTDHGCVVVHGHSISPRVEERSNRIGIDTGAYRTGILTALAIEGEERWYIDTQAPTEAAASAAH